MNQVEELMQKYTYVKQMLETEVDILMKEFSFEHHYNPIEHMKSRIKSEKSIQEKLRKKGYEYNVQNILMHVEDIVGLRIVCSFLSDVYDLVGVLLQSKNMIVKERKDYIANPKSTGYSSYHLIVLVPIYLKGRTEYFSAEIQIRTVAMDFWATLDHKIQYKFEKDIPVEVREKMYDYSKTIQELDNKMLSLNELMQKYKKDL